MTMEIPIAIVGFVLFFIFVLVSELLSTRKAIKHLKFFHKAEITLLELKSSFTDLKHQVAIQKKDIEIMSERIKTLSEMMHSMKYRLELISAMTTLLHFKYWWNTVGKEEYEIIRRKNHSQKVLPVLDHRP